MVAIAHRPIPALIISILSLPFYHLVKFEWVFIDVPRSVVQMAELKERARGAVATPEGCRMIRKMISRIIREMISRHKMIRKLIISFSVQLA